MEFVYKVGQVLKLKYGVFEILEAKRVFRSNQKIRDKKYSCRCKHCGEINEILENTLINNMGSCKACSDVRSFGERFFYWFLKQTNIKFETEFSPQWIGRKRFDFYFRLNNVDIIVEIDGAQHYKRSHKRLTCDEIKDIDEYKQRMAADNGYKVIRISCDKSQPNIMKESIINSELRNLFDLDKIDWRKCFYMSMSSSQREACRLWNEGVTTTREISQIIGLAQNYVSKLLIGCADFGFCDYDPKLESIKGAKCSTNGKTVICKNNNVTYNSATECSRKSLEDFGVFLKGSGITRVCRKERESYKGFSFEYLD